MNTAALVGAFLVGLLGSLHCIAMCGGIVGSLTLGIGAHAGRARRVGYFLLYQAGRVVSYAVAGALVGATGSVLVDAAYEARLYAMGLSGVFLIALGLYLAGWWNPLGAVERAGARLWRHVHPLGRRLLPIDHPLKAFTFGALWGWLPCGMVYAALAGALAAGSAFSGAQMMLLFGLGTIPALALAGALTRWLDTAARLLWLRRAAGIALLLFGVYVLSGIIPDLSSQPIQSMHAHHAI